jgi:epoxyqueuosine reductase
VLIAIGNSGDAGLAEEAERLLNDAAPLVRAMAIWALRRLLPPEALARHAAERLNQESDPDVREEWREAMAPAAEALA